MRVPLSAYGSVDTEIHTLAGGAYTQYIYTCIYVTLNNGYAIRMLLYLCTYCCCCYYDYNCKTTIIITLLCVCTYTIVVYASQQMGMGKFYNATAVYSLRRPNETIYYIHVIIYT